MPLLPHTFFYAERASLRAPSHLTRSSFDTLIIGCHRFDYMF
jgi:hypothetical protein